MIEYDCQYSYGSEAVEFGAVLGARRDVCKRRAAPTLRPMIG